VGKYLYPINVESERQLIHAAAICFSVVLNGEVAMKQKFAVAFFAVAIENLSSTQA